MHEKRDCDFIGVRGIQLLVFTADGLLLERDIELECRIWSNTDMHDIADVFHNCLPLCGAFPLGEKAEMVPHTNWNKRISRDSRNYDVPLMAGQGNPPLRMLNEDAETIPPSFRYQPSRGVSPFRMHGEKENVLLPTSPRRYA